MTPPCVRVTKPAHNSRVFGTTNIEGTSTGCPAGSRVVCEILGANSFRLTLETTTKEDGSWLIENVSLDRAQGEVELTARLAQPAAEHEVSFMVASNAQVSH